MIPSDQMIIRRYKPLCHFDDTLRNGLRPGQAEEYEKREGQVSKPAREHERQRATQTESIKLINGEEMDLAGGLDQARGDARENYYASCWRLGTDEDPGIWERYANGRGVAIETTYNQLEQYVAPEENLRMGIIRYLDYEEQYTPNRGFASLYFFKHREFEDEQEFRILTNRGGNPTIWTDGRETPPEMRPDNESHIRLSADMDALINRVILSPEADEEVRMQVESTLDEHGVSAPVVPSRRTQPDAHYDTYDAELAGAANYEENTEYLDEIIKCFVKETNWDVWNTVDVVQLNQYGNLNPRWMFIECFRYTDESPERTMYGQEHLDYEVRVHRVIDGEYQNTVVNKTAEETNEKLSEIDGFSI